MGVYILIGGVDVNAEKALVDCAGSVGNTSYRPHRGGELVSGCRSGAEGCQVSQARMCDVKERKGLD